MSVISTDSRIFKPSTIEGHKAREFAARWLQPALLQLSRFAAALLLPAALLVLWQIAVNKQWMPEQILPAPGLVLQTLLDLWAAGDLQPHLLISASRVG